MFFALVNITTIISSGITIHSELSISLSACLATAFICSLMELIEAVASNSLFPSTSQILTSSLLSYPLSRTYLSSGYKTPYLVDTSHPPIQHL